ncbi:MAG: FapA family protein [Eubacteriales bacterium]|nr:FapA family protein [Eubacteriales bacterium]
MSDQELDRLLAEVLNDGPKTDTPQDDHPARRLQEDTPVSEDAPGLIGVRNGQIWVQNPRNDGPPAKLIPSGLKILVNGVVIKETVYLHESDQIAYEPRIDLVPPRVEVIKSPNKLLAYITIAYGQRIEHILDDQEPKKLITLATKAIPHPTEPPTFAQIASALERAGVSHGVDQTSLSQISLEPREGRFVIARGTPPGPSTDGTIEILFSLLDEAIIQQNKHGNVDYRERRRLSTVAKGSVLARKLPGQPGSPGVGVSGEVILPIPPKQVYLVCGSGTALQAGGSEVVATEAGQPAYDAQSHTYTFRVSPVLQVDGNVDMESGNVRFEGSIDIRGEIKPGMIVFSGDSLYVGGSVERAQVGAFGSIRIRGAVINGTVTAGCPNVSAFQVVAEDLNKVLKEMGALISALQQIYSNPSMSRVTIDFAQLLQRVIDMRFRNLPSSVTGLLAHLRHIINMLPENVRVNLADLEYYFDGINLLRLQSLDQLQTLYKNFSQATICLHEKDPKPSNLLLFSAMNSRLRASGEVTIAGEGCYATQVDAGGNITVAKTVRGGYAISDGGAVTIDEAGSEMGVTTLVRVAAHNLVKIERAYPGVHVYVGSQKFDVTEEVVCLRVFQDPQGNLKTNYRVL